MLQQNTHWFPGHMQKALREIKNRLQVIDVVVEIVDSRAPISSKNPYLEELTKSKKRVIVMNKKDLCDLSKINPFIEYYKQKGYEVLLTDLNNKNDVNLITKTIINLGQEKVNKAKSRGFKSIAIRTMIIGIPNVGKSTLINRLAHRNKTLTANRPGLTRAQQWIKISDQIELLDTPGILPPHYDDKDIAMNLALLGAIKENILPQHELIIALLDFMKLNYASALVERYQINNEDLQLSNDEILEKIGIKRGVLLKQGQVDLEKTEYLILKEFKNGIITKVVIDTLC